MAVEIVKMTGEELQRIWERSGLKNTDIKPRLGISPATYYNYIKASKEPIPLDVEAKIDKDPQLADAKNRELSTVNGEAPIKPSELVRFMTDTFQLLRDQSANMGRAVDSLSDDNKLLRKLVEAGLDAGALRWDKKAS